MIDPCQLCGCVGDYVRARDVERVLAEICACDCHGAFVLVQRHRAPIPEETP